MKTGLKIFLTGWAVCYIFAFIGGVWLIVEGYTFQGLLFCIIAMITIASSIAQIFAIKETEKRPW